jgi:hypothetical protein
LSADTIRAARRVTRLSRFNDDDARECVTMRADMSNESRDNFLINRSSTWFGVAPDDVRIARMEDELIVLRRAVTLLVKDRPDLLRLLGSSPSRRGENRQ